jgi:hypothetical protein
MVATKTLQLGLLAAILLVAGTARAGTARQTTTFLVDANEGAVCRWIDQNTTALDESSGTEVLEVRGRQSTLRTETKEGTFTVVVDHGLHHACSNGQGEFHTVLLKSDNPDLVSQETKIRVEREGVGSRVTITVIANVTTHSAMAIALGIRPSIRGMRKLLETHFGSPNEQ